MPEIVFNDISIIPEEKELEKIVGKNYGWHLKTILKKRNLFFRIPHKSYFKLVFVFGDKAVKEIENSRISGDLIETLLNAKKYAEGRGLPIDIKNQKYMGDIKKLIEIKIQN